MAEIFISYKSERRSAAEHMAEVLRRHGYSVWFDYSLVKGRDFGLQIDSQVRQARVLLVLWCTRSIGSRWVHEEVDLAQHLNILLPVKIEPCDLPVGNRRQEHVDLSGWDGAPRGHQLDPLLDAIANLVGRQPVPDYHGLRDYEGTWRRFGALSLKSFALATPLEPETGERKLPERVEGNVPKPQTMAPPPHRAPVGNDAERDWRTHDLDTCEDPGLLKAYAAKWDAAEPVWAYKARQKATGLETAEQRRQSEERERQAREAEARQRAAEEQAARERGVEGQRQRETETQAARDREAPVESYRREGRLPAEPGAGKTKWFKDIDIGPEMVVVPPGVFMMGEGTRQHKVAINAPFAVGRFAITFAEWDAAGLTKPGDQGWGRGRRPVINVSWEDARAYAEWLSKKSGKTYRLPSEAEWEYCCRAGTTTANALGDSITPQQAQFSAMQTVEVGKFPPNDWGLYDMHGNVWEWCEDAYDASSRVLRGGSWFYDPNGLRSAYRLRNRPGSRDVGIGFRLARTL